MWRDEILKKGYSCKKKKNLKNAISFAESLKHFSPFTTFQQPFSFFNTAFSRRWGYKIVAKILFTQ